MAAPHTPSTDMKFIFLLRNLGNPPFFAPLWDRNGPKRSNSHKRPCKRCDMTLVKSNSLREDFLAWQCRIRQIAMRQDGGRPSPGMRPRVLDTTEHEFASA